MLLLSVMVPSSLENRSEGFPRTAYFIPGCDGMGVGAISEIVPAAAASFKKGHFLVGKKPLRA